MTASKILRAVVLVTLALICCKLAKGQSQPPLCNSVSVTISLQGGQSFDRQVSDLIFKMEPLKSGGWNLSLEDAQGNDFIYPANLPLRFNSSQTFGAGYGLTARESLRPGARELRFLLSESEYEHIDPYVTNALWPYAAPSPEHAIDEFLDIRNKLRTGLLRLSVTGSDVASNDEVRSADFEIEFIAPVDYGFALPLTPGSKPCPVSTLPMRERLPARIPMADPAKYRGIRDGADWKNPYVIITREGFDLRFQGGHLNGPLSALAEDLIGLPDSAWPYGRVLIAEEIGVRSAGDDAIIGKNRSEAERMLRELGLAVDWWPSA